MKMYALFLLLIALPLLAWSANQHDLNKLIQLEQTQSVYLDLSNTDLRNYSFIPGNIDLQKANLSHSNLSGVDLSKMNLGGADLSYADLSNAKLHQVNLADANLDHANLTNAQLQQTDLSRANLNFAILTQANLQQAILTRTNLTCANLNQADLTRSTFTEAIISGASFINTLTAEISGYDSVVDKKVGC